MDISYIFTHDPLWAVTHTACAWTETLKFKTTWRVTFSIFGHSPCVSRDSERDFENRKEISNLSQIFRNVQTWYVNALRWKNRPCRPLHKETRRRIIDRYLTAEGPKAISTAARATPGTVYCIIRHHETFSTCEALSQGGRSYPS